MDMERKRKAEIVENCGFFSEMTKKNGSDTSLSLDFFGLEHCLPGHSYGPCARSNYVIHVVIDGKGILDYGGRRWEIGKGQMFILFPGEVTTYYADQEDPWYYCWFGFQGNPADRIVESIGFSSQTPVLSFEGSSMVESKIKEMLDSKTLTLDGQLRRNAEMMQILSDMIIEGAQKAGNGRGLTSFSYSEYAVRYINNHFSEKIRIQDLANRIGISRSYLVKLVKQVTGMSPQEYLIEIRMRRASDLLGRSNDPIQSIAAECGYDDALAFSKVFKSKFGVNPSEYRMQHNKIFPERTENSD